MIDVAPAEPAGSATPQQRHHWRALDGLRGVAVLAVLLFHAGVPGADGGFLGVSTFFVLSGFLLTSLVLAEHDRHGRVDLRRYAGRRARRILPVAGVGLALAVAVTAWIGNAASRTELPGDVAAAGSGLINWRLLVGDRSYGALFDEPSALNHYWSLAVEVQAYLVLPLLLLAGLHWGRRGVAGALAGGVVLAVGLAQLGGADLAYYGTHSRIAEILAGGLAAVTASAVLAGRTDWRPARSERLLTHVLAPVALVALVAGVVLVDVDSPWLQRGGLALHGVLAAVVVLAAIRPGPVGRLLSWRPLVALGLVSYAVYVVHWPVFMVLDATRVPQPTLRLGLQLGITLTLAVLVGRLVEQPIRSWMPQARTTTRWVGAISATALVAAVFVAVRAPEPVDVTDAGRVLAAAPTASLPEATTEPRKPRIAVFGDSTALTTALGVVDWSAGDQPLDWAGAATWPGCGVGREGESRPPDTDVPAPLHRYCQTWPTSWPEVAARGEADVAVVQAGLVDANDRRVEPAGPWRSPGDSVYDAYLRDEMLAVVDGFAARGVRVVWLTVAPPNDQASGLALLVPRDPGRIQAVNNVIRSLPAMRPGQVEVLDLDGWLATRSDDAALRPDGVHFSRSGAVAAVSGWLGPELAALIGRTDLAPRATHPTTPPTPPSLVTAAAPTTVPLDLRVTTVGCSDDPALAQWGASARQFAVRHTPWCSGALPAVPTADLVVLDTRGVTPALSAADLDALAGRAVLVLTDDEIPAAVGDAVATDPDHRLVLAETRRGSALGPAIVWAWAELDQRSRTRTLRDDLETAS